MFRDLIIAAHNDAVSKLREKINSELSGKLPFGGLGL
ncbi:MAG: YbaB/EbfC family nucleoid-associated protein [Spirochaetales bacterium]|nr:YbaB/EbfC family nucleoid-associated protein [Spirochaetales bacterium]